MKTKMLLFAILIGFMCASCEIEEPKFNYEFTITRLVYSTPYSLNYNLFHVRNITENNISENESNYFVMLYTYSYIETKNDTIIYYIGTCTKKNL